MHSHWHQAIENSQAEVLKHTSICPGVVPRWLSREETAIFQLAYEKKNLKKAIFLRRSWQSCQPHSAGPWQLKLAGPLFSHDLFAVSLKVYLFGRQANTLNPWFHLSWKVWANPRWACGYQLLLYVPCPGRFLSR